MNQNPKIVTIATAVIIVGALAYIFWPSGDAAGGGGASGKLFFSNDDGNSFFLDDNRKIAPFSKDGKDAYRAYVFKCADGKKFVAYLERYTADAKKKLEANMAASAAGKSS